VGSDILPVGGSGCAGQHQRRVGGLPRPVEAAGDRTPSLPFDGRNDPGPDTRRPAAGGRTLCQGRPLRRPADPLDGFFVDSWDAADELICAGRDAIAALATESTRRPLLNRAWHNPAAGDLLREALGGDPAPRRALAPTPERPVRGTVRPRTQPRRGTFRLRRPGDFDLAFDGELRADESSHEPTRTRWTEIRIYHTRSGKYVLECVGRTTVPGERDRVAVQVCDRAADVPEALRRPTSNGSRYLTTVAFRALERASTFEPALSPTETI
jgi:hypothetical protein